MGHAKVDNISEFFLNKLALAGKVNIGECVCELVDRGEAVHASEGDYYEDYMIAQVLVEVIDFYGEAGVIEPVELTPEQSDALDSNDPEEFYEIIDTIYWRFTEGKHEAFERGELPILRNISN